MASTASVIVYVLGGAFLCTATVAVLVAYLRRRRKLNWFEKSVLEISKGDPEIIHYGRGSTDAVTKAQEDEGWMAYDYQSKKSRGTANRGVHFPADVPENSTRMPTRRRQSRIIYLPPSDLDALTASAAGSLPLFDVAMGKDVSGKFCVPKTHKTSFSMFRTLDMNKIDRDLYDLRQNSLLKNEQILGLCGSLHMSLKFDSSASLLTVGLIQAANLVARRTDDNPPNPYFKVHLIPSELTSEQQIFESERYQSARSTMLGDEFVFAVPNGSIRSCQLEVTAHDSDENASEDECIGYCWLALDRVDVAEDSTSKTDFWAEILPFETGDKDSSGEILFSTGYSPKTQRLSVTVIKARNLIDTEGMTEPPDSCVKVAVYANNKKLKQRRTATKKAAYHPSFNETLTFNIPKNSICDLVLSINVCRERSAFRRSKILGRVEVPLHKCKHLWRALIRGQDSKATWYQLEK